MARSVPVHRLWADEVLELAEESGPRPFYMPDRTRITRRDILGFIERCSGEGLPKFNVQRLRITWIVGHLSAGTPLSALVRASGVGVGQLGKYLRFVAPVERGRLPHDGSRGRSDDDRRPAAHCRSATRSVIRPRPARLGDRPGGR